MSTIDEIKTRINIVDLVSETVQLRRSGKNYTGFCPFHPNTRTPAFAVFPDSGTWRCFGQCNEGGDIFKFIMKREGWDFSEALRFLADKAGVQLRAPLPEEQAAAEEHENLRSLLEEAVGFFQRQLFNTGAGQLALDYLCQKRGLREDTLKDFGLGYAPNSLDATQRYFKSKGVSMEALQAVGLVSERETGEIFDRFRHRVMFPIRDERGRMTGFGARTLDPNDIPKFLNSPQTVLFDKGRLLYGLDRARKTIRELDQAVIVEGYMDVVILHQAGFTNVVSSMGTALTEHHFYHLKRFSRRIVLALDSDTAGEKATLRGLQIARQAMDHEQEAIFDARGLLGYEARVKADIRVTTLPPGLDPDEVVNQDPAEWLRLVEAARPVVEHVMETLVAAQKVDDPKVKAEIAAQVLPLIEDVPSSVERDAYRQRLARLLKVDERALFGGARVGSAKPGSKRSSKGSTGPSVGGALPSALIDNYNKEAHCLGVLLRRPDLLYQVDRKLQELGLSRMTSQDFQHADHQLILRLIIEAVEQDIVEPLEFVLNNLSLSMMELADELLAKTANLDLSHERVQEDLIRSLLNLRSRSLYQDIEYHQFLIEEAQNQDNSDLPQYLQTMVQLTDKKRRLDLAIKRYTTRTPIAHFAG